MTEEANLPSWLPSWFSEDIAVPFKAGISHVFLIHGDIDGLVIDPDTSDETKKSYVELRQFFEKIFDEREMVCFYNIASGIRFLTPDMEKKFRAINKIDGDSTTAAKDDPVAAAKAGLAAKRGIPREPEAVLPMIEKVLKTEPDCAVIINSIDFIAPQGGPGGMLPAPERVTIERIKNWAHDGRIRKNNSMVILLTDDVSKVSGELKRSGTQIHQVFISRPDKSQRKDFLESLTRESREYQALQLRKKSLENNVRNTKPSSDRKRKTRDRAEEARDIEQQMEKIKKVVKLFLLPDDFDCEIFAHATQGMSFHQIMDMFLHSRTTSKPINLDYVKNKKREILNAEYGDILEIVDPQKGLEDIGGLEHIKTFMTEVLVAIKKAESRLVPMGITLMGPPGTGKTAIVEALAKEAGFNFVKTKNIRSMWVGESEGRMQKLVYALRNLAPVVVMNDEADLADAQRDAPKGDSGVSERLMKMWMELLSDPKIRGQILVISCTNRPDRIDAALKRSGRSDDRILVPMPSAAEIPPIFAVMFKRHKIPTTVADFTPYIASVQNFSGADIENIVLKAFRFAFRQKKEVVDDTALREAIGDFIQNANQAQIDLMTITGILECSSRRLLPTNIKEVVAGIRARNLVENLDAMIMQIKASNIVALD